MAFNATVPSPMYTTSNTIFASSQPFAKKPSGNIVASINAAVSSTVSMLQLSQRSGARRARPPRPACTSAPRNANNPPLAITAAMCIHFTWA